MARLPKLNLKQVSMVREPLSNAGPSRVACQKCGLHVRCKTPFLYPHVPEGWTRKLLAVGDMPGQERVDNIYILSPFVAAVGKLLRQMWRDAKHYKDIDVALVNAVRCQPYKNSKPSMDQVRACRPFLLQVLHKLKPEYVIGLGDTALRSLRNNGDSNITKHRGKSFQVPGL